MMYSAYKLNKQGDNIQLMCSFSYLEPVGGFKSLTYNSVETLHAASLVTGNIHANGRKHVTEYSVIMIISL